MSTRLGQNSARACGRSRATMRSGGGAAAVPAVLLMSY